ncbi:hypothetical protein NLM33_36830 [Bradyrhizobium sp. CCGUVB1N3]|uniref:hypothetical protein n=1 Tax=Bradyrhizobium sp. CCGUVB1N3 TaxID=2949629 RepID=UPI0020B1C0D1|nr:hypothetical protein [Bradyrhizobium sp. CCGUVB1N3]MCP3475815.1 hypothetical protein [Bradyrhizobium sp. CCGUVB1N3]
MNSIQKTRKVMRPEIEVGRALVIAREGYFSERISLGIQLLIGTCQRRRAVTGAHRGSDDCPAPIFSPHKVRHAFATYGERDLGFGEEEADLILDHLEGVSSKDVTRQFYSSDPRARRKWAAATRRSHPD